MIFGALILLTSYFRLDMKPFFIKLTLRIIATFSGLLGITSFIFFIPIFLRGSNEIPLEFMILFIIFFILFCIYSIYIGYLAWFCWSPTTVRHIIGLLALILFGQIDSLIPQPTNSPSYLALWMLSTAVASYFLYRITVCYCCRELFPKHSDDSNAKELIN